MKQRLLATAIVGTVVIGVLAVVVPIPAVADAPQQGNGKCWADATDNPCGPCEEWKQNCQKAVCIPIPGCIPDEPGDPNPQG